MVYPSAVDHLDLQKFTQLLGRKGKDKIEWNVWKYNYRKLKFQAIINALRFVGFVNSTDTLTALGKRFVFGRDGNAMIIGLVQSEYFDLFRELLKEDRSDEKLFDILSLGCEIPVPEKQRRSMYKTFVDLSSCTGLLRVKDFRVALTKQGKDAVEKHCKIPLWAYDLTLFEESTRIEKFKALYYETGHPFRDIVKEAFSELGFEAKNLPKKVQGIPDIEINTVGFTAVVETKGENKQIGENDVNQVLKSQSRPDFKGQRLIFVGNAFRLKPPSGRGEFFHQNAVTLAESKGITLVSSFFLLDALRTKWKEKAFSLEKACSNLSKNGLCAKLA